MLKVSERQDFERAGQCRDQLKWLEQVEAPSSVEVLGTGDADVVGFARDGDDAVGVLLRVRDGRVVAREHAFMENVTEEQDEAVLNFLLVRSYVPLTGRVRRVVLPFPPSEVELLGRNFSPRPSGKCRNAAPRGAGSTSRTRTPVTCWKACGSSPSRPTSAQATRSTRLGGTSV